MPRFINEFENLKHLELNSNRFNIFPDLDLKNLNYLSLRLNQLTTIPSSIDKLQKLVKLDIANNQIKEVPVSIGTLQNLESLNISCNQIKELPASIGSLPNLQGLDISYNQISRLPIELNQTSAFKVLGASNNYLSKLSVDNLPKNLSNVDFTLNEFDHLPECIVRIKPASLKFDYNPIKDIPSALFKNNTNPQVFLHFNNCGLSSFPDTLTNVNIYDLFAPNNAISVLPAKLGQNKFISLIDLANNPISKIPEYMLDQNVSLILNDTKIQHLPDLKSTTTLHLKNTPISEFPDLRNIKKMNSLDIRGTDIEKIPSYVKDIKITQVFISKPGLKRFFSSECAVFINEDSWYDLSSYDRDYRMQHDIYTHNYNKNNH